MARRYFSQSTYPDEHKSFLDFAASIKYPGHLAIGMHRADVPGVHYVVLGQDQVEDLIESLIKYYDRQKAQRNQPKRISGGDI